MKRILLVIVLIVYGLVVFVLSASANGSSKNDPATPTFNKEVVRIFQANCQVCHHPGDIAPFSLMTYADAAPRANLIKRATQNRIMPPWKPVEGCGEFQGVRRLSDEDIATLARWAEASAPPGNPADLPPPLEFPDGWPLGEPDLVMDSGIDYTPDRMRRDDYHCFTMAADFKEDQWLSAVDIQPGERSMVHHVLLFVDRTGESADLEEYPGSGYTCFGGPGINNIDIIGGWAPGARTQFLPEGIGMQIPAGSRIIMQVHYHPQGPPPADRTKLGLYLANPPVEKQFYMIPIIDRNYRQLFIPANDPRYEVSLQQPLRIPVDLRGLSIAPHMHLLGREIEIKATKPDGQTECLVSINDWDFNWQGSYFFAKSAALPAGTLINMTAVYDNSSNNPRNPNRPPQNVRWGEGTTDEMFLAFAGITIDAQQLGDTNWVMSKELEELLQPVMVMGGDPAGTDQDSGHTSHH